MILCQAVVQAISFEWKWSQEALPVGGNAVEFKFEK